VLQMIVMLAISLTRFQQLACFCRQNEYISELDDDLWAHKGGKEISCYFTMK
jgi:hypothetical protein